MWPSEVCIACNDITVVLTVKLFSTSRLTIRTPGGVLATENQPVRVKTAYANLNLELGKACGKANFIAVIIFQAMLTR